VSSETVRNCFRYTGILPVIQNNEELVTNNNEELVTDDNKDELIEELHADIEALHLRNVIDLNNYINYLEKNDTNEVLNDQKIIDLVTNIEEPEVNQSDGKEDDNSIEICQITYNEALNTIELLEQYLFQQNFSNMV
ncbi:2148_t:CDS:1, partial [Racocetra fulgida]